MILRTFLAAAAFSVASFVAIRAAAHGDVHPRIDALTKELEASPDDARLMKARGLLFALDEDWSSALRDFSRAYVLSPGEPALEHHLGNACLHLGAPSEAKAFLDAALIRDPTQPDAYLLRARAEVALDELDAALSDFDVALAQSASPSPETYLERANAIMSLEPDRVEEALSGLEEGRRRLGPLVTLVERAVELSRGDRALLLIDELPSGLASTYRWMAKRGAVLAAEARTDEASRTYRDALATIDGLPMARRSSEATQRDRAEIERALDALPPTAPSLTPLADDSSARTWLWAAIAACIIGLVTVAWRTRSRRDATPRRPA